MKLSHCITIKGDHWFQTEVEEGISMLEKWRRARMFMRTSWSGTSRLSRWRARIMTTTSWFPLVRYGATGTSPCQLMTGQKQVQWISYKYLGTMIWSNSWSAPYVLLRYLNNTNCSITLQILLVSNVYQLCKGDSIKLNFGFHDYRVPRNWCDFCKIKRNWETGVISTNVAKLNLNIPMA